MKSILTEKFKQLLADEFNSTISSVTSNTTYHLVGAKQDPFIGVVPYPEESIYETTYQLYDEIIFGKKILESDVNFMIRNIPWTSGTIYDAYDDKDPELASKDFYVIADQEDGSYSVFKCLYRNTINPESIYKPLLVQTDPTDEIYITGHGYHWKYMFSINSTIYDKFANSNYVPVLIEDVVQNAAVPGTLDAILLENSGSEYNNYAFGRVKQANFDNNILKVSIESDDVLTVKTYDVSYTSNGVFQQGDVVNISVPGANTVTAEVYKTSVLNSSISFEITANTETIGDNTIANANGDIILESGGVTASVDSIREQSLPNLSIATNFYKDSVLYIRGGTGAGQIKNITSYEILGNDRVVTLDSAFTSPIDTISTFSILPKVNIIGDGTGAIGLAEVETAANSISEVQIINRGSGYTFASATISGNNGIISANGTPILENEAELRPIISPIGGHGSNTVIELFGSAIGISTDFENSEVNDYSSFSKIALVKNLLFNNVQLTVNSLTNGDFTVGEAVAQENLIASGEVDSIDVDNNILTLTNVLGDFEVSANNFLIGSSNVEIISINNSNQTFNGDIELQISPIISSYVVGEKVTQENSNATGTIIKNSVSSINITNVMGNFTTDTNDVLVGNDSGARSLITSIGDRRIVDNSGEIIYMENISELQRSSTTSEKIKLIIKF